VNNLDIARWRLRSQHLAAPHAAAAGEVVGSLLAVQAENPSQAAWAVAARTRRPDQADLATLLDEGAVLRTHVLRPTWHFVRADDLGWLLDLTGPRVQRVTGQQLRTVHGLDERAIERAVAAVTEALAGRGQLTRGQLADELRERGIEANGQMLMILLAHAELDGLICSGAVGDGEHTYALMAERVPASRRLDRVEALAELALRYFTGHGPATERDLAYWATLTPHRRACRPAPDPRPARLIPPRRAHLLARPADPPNGPQQPTGHLLQLRRRRRRAAHAAPSRNRTAAGMAVECARRTQ
jgi:Winged helix DNA-binding domain